MALMYIAGYITRNDGQPNEYETIFIIKSMKNILIQLTMENSGFFLTTLANGYFFFLSSFSIQ